MLTLFSTAKPFRGHSAVIQRNALKSWTLLHPDVEVILFGDDEGAAETCREFGIRHEPHVVRNESGLKRIDYYFDRAQEIARHDTLCYANCDIILTDDFTQAVRRIRSSNPNFLVIGRRWDTDISATVDFSNPNWQKKTRQLALDTNDQKDEWWIDFFSFSRGLYLGKIPPLVVGRVVWDNFLIWRALTLGAAVVDVSPSVVAIHQNHDYAYHPLGKYGVWNDEQTQQNLRYAGGMGHMRNIADATFVLDMSGLHPNTRRHWNAIRRTASTAGRAIRFKFLNPVWFFFLGLTRPLRHALGLKARQR
jgi:hypothetical protein